MGIQIPKLLLWFRLRSGLNRNCSGSCEVGPDDSSTPTVKYWVRIELRMNISDSSTFQICCVFFMFALTLSDLSYILLLILLHGCWIPFCSLSVLKRLSDSRDSRLLNKLLKADCCVIQWEKQKAVSQGTFFCSAHPCLLFSCLPASSLCLVSLPSSLSPSVNTPPGGSVTRRSPSVSGFSPAGWRFRMWAAPHLPCAPARALRYWSFMLCSPNKHPRACLFCTLI